MAKKIENPPAPVEAEIVAPPMGEIEEPEGSTPGERINYHVGMAQHHGRQALAHLIMAGWELARQKAAIGYGGWQDWCGANLQITKATADRYIGFFHKTVGEARNAAEIPVAKKPTLQELAVATVGMEDKSATRAMIDLGIIKRFKNSNGNSWGGANRGQGRKAKGAAEVAAELKAVAENESVIWASAKGSLDNLVQLDAKRGVFQRLSGDHLATVAGLLADLSKKAAQALKQRLADGDTGRADLRVGQGRDSARPSLPQSC